MQNLSILTKCLVINHYHQQSLDPSKVEKQVKSKINVFFLGYWYPKKNNGYTNLLILTKIAQNMPIDIKF